MGCGGSKSSDITAASDIDIWLETEDDPIPIENVLSSYPPPKPSRRKKIDIFDKNEYKIVESRAKEAPSDVGNSFEKLTDYLTSGISLDIEKVWAIFCWIGSQSSNKNLQDGPEDSPNTLMRKINKRLVSNSYLFTRMCREANVHCVLLNGTAKAAGYEVGDAVEKLQEFKCRWCAVYLEGEWRIVHPHWAFVAVSGHSTGKFTLVEKQGKATREKEEQSDGTTISRFNDYYFLTDPENFVTVAMADDPSWQLITKPYDLKTFAKIPFLKQSFFEQQFKVEGEFSGCKDSVDGKSSLSIKAKNDKWEEGFLTYELFYNDEESKNKLPAEKQLSRYVIMQRSKGQWIFEIRFPLAGVYKININVTIGLWETWLCSFKLFGKEVLDEPMLCDVGMIGWGPSFNTEKVGLSSPSQTKGIVSVLVREESTFKFNITKRITVRTVLVHKDVPEETLQKHVEQKQTSSNKNKNIEVNVSVPTDGEYALRFFTTMRNTNIEENACNYLLKTRTKKRKKRENVTERKARETLQDATHNTNIELGDLSKAIDIFNRLNLEDKNDLTKALDRQEHLEIKKDLNDAIARRHRDILDNAIIRATHSKFKEPLRPRIQQAESVREELRVLDRFAHDILEMKQSTISELRSYKTPPDAVRDVMRGSFLLLGEQEWKVEEWEDLQAMMGELGKQSLLSRVKRFDTVNVNTEQTNIVQGYLAKHEETEVRQSSPAAGTFYVWAHNVINKVRSNVTTIPQEEPPKTAVSGRKKK